MQQLIKADGGSGEYQELALPMLGLWNTLLTVRGLGCKVCMRAAGLLQGEVASRVAAVRGA